MTSSPNRFQQALLRNFREQPRSIYCRQISSSGETVITWSDLERSCGRFSRAYRHANVPPGAVVLIFLRHVPELYGAFFGAMFAGAIPAFMPCSSPKQDTGIYWKSHDALLRKIKPAAIVTDRATLAEMGLAGLPLDRIPVIIVEETENAALEIFQHDEDSTCLLQHSSGTTGLKKGVALSYGSIVRQIESYADRIGLTQDDNIVSWLPLYHDMGLIACLILPTYFAVRFTHIDPFVWTSTPALLFDYIVKDKGTLSWLPNFAFEHLAATNGRRASNWDMSGVRALINCSEPCKPATFDRFAAAFAASGVRPDQLQCCYAMAETVFAVAQTELGALPLRLTFDPLSLERGKTPALATGGGGVELLETGCVINGLQLSVHDEHGQALANCCVGEIGLSGDFIFSGYNCDPDLTADRVRDGVYFSRDIGFIWEDRVFVLGRTDDLIIVNGRNLYAHEVEAQISRVPGIKAGRATAFAVFDDRAGSGALTILAERLATGTHSDQEIQDGVISVVRSVFNVVPKAVKLLNEGELIKTSSGKISRVENARRYESGSV